MEKDKRVKPGNIDITLHRLNSCPTDNPRFHLNYAGALDRLDLHFQPLNTADPHQVTKILYEVYNDIVFGHSYRLLGNRNDAEDATQEVYVKAQRGLLSCTQEELEARPWLLTIGTNHCIDQLRRSNKVHWQPIKDLPDYHPKMVANDDPARDTHQKLREELILQTLDNLPPHYRKVLVGFYYHDLSCEQVGKTLGRSRSAAKSLALRARQVFAHEYKKLGGGPEDV